MDTKNIEGTFSKGCTVVVPSQISGIQIRSGTEYILNNRRVIIGKSRAKGKFFYARVGGLKELERDDIYS